MSTVILLTSSPPQVFARSPTPADSSSPLPSTAALLQGESPGRKKFKVQISRREGFPTGFSTARQVLAEKSGAENAEIGTPRRHRFRSSQEQDIVKIPQERAIRTKSPAASVAGSTIEVALHAESERQLGLKETKVLSKDGKKQNDDPNETSHLQRAVARRTDWTPPKAQIRRDDHEKTMEYSAGFMNGMLSSFTYPNEIARTKVPHAQEPSNPAKRRRVEPAVKVGSRIEASSVPKLVKTSSVLGKSSVQRTQSPSKKPLTITGLATSNYLGLEASAETPLMQYLTSTQAQLGDNGAEAGLQTKVQKTKEAVKKVKATKKNEPKSLLLSPASAIRKYEDQDAIFGSASQLARDESPTFIRETIKAMKESESFVMSDPVCSPQRTQLASVENTPKTGTSKFRRTQNLWSAAGRDEDNALLHVDTVDLSDSPAVRAAFAGKDVLVQPATRRLAPSGKSNLSLRGGVSPLSPHGKGTVIDIGDIATPCIVPARSYSSTTRQASPRKSPTCTTSAQPAPILDETAEPAPQKEVPPPKPNYVGFSTQDLNKQIKFFGFKAMRKREKMIELLNRCWEEKYGSHEEPAETGPEAAPFGDFLSKVHDLSARPEPKVKKPRVRKKKDEAEQRSGETSVPKPRQRKKREPKSGVTGGETEKPKATRKRKAKGAATESILDVDSVWDTIPEELRALEAFEDWAKPERKPKAKAKTQSASVIIESQVPPTPPATLPPVAAATITELPEEVDRNEPVTADTIVPPQKTDPALVPEFVSVNSPLQTSSSSSIASAILHQSRSSDPTRNHNINPTWHEKILLYDPIVLEDLAAWLNTEGLGAIGEDKEVSALEVREWCENQGICCLWRGGWRGNKTVQA